MRKTLLWFVVAMVVFMLVLKWVGAPDWFIELAIIGECVVFVAIKTR